MRQLLILRHAEASWGSPQADHARPLNAQGQNAAAAMRGAVRSHGFQPELVLVSSARRTLETLAALAPWIALPEIQILDSLYLADRTALMDMLGGVPPAIQRVMLIGHNPGLHQIALELSAQAADAASLRRLREGYPTGALAEFAVPQSWTALADHPASARLLRFIAPRDMTTDYAP